MKQYLYTPDGTYTHYLCRDKEVIADKDEKEWDSDLEDFDLQKPVKTSRSISPPSVPEIAVNPPCSFTPIYLFSSLASESLYNAHVHEEQN